MNSKRICETRFQPLLSSTGMAKFWLFKSEPSAYSIDDLKKDGATCWDGIRNYQARNLIRDEIRKGDRVLLYHSSASPPGVAGLARVVREAYPDDTALDPKHPQFDPISKRDEPTWFMVDIEWEETFPQVVSLSEIRAKPQLKDMVLVNNSRLSVQPVRKKEFERILKMAGS